MNNYKKSNSIILYGGIVVVLLGLTFFAAWSAHKYENEDHLLKFTMLANSKIERLSNKLNNLTEIELQGLANFYRGTDDVDAEKFKNYSNHLLKNNSIQAWEWIEAIPEYKKEKFEQLVRNSGEEHFSIGEKNSLGVRVNATGRDWYYPVLHVNPREGNEKALGYDLGSEPLRRKALLKALETKNVTATEAITLVQETGKQKGMLVYYPVFAQSDSLLIKGFALAVLRFGSLLESVGPHSGVQIKLTMIQDDGVSTILGKTYINDGLTNESQLSIKRSLLFCGKNISITAYAGKEFLRLHPQQLGLITGMLGSIITIIFLVIFSLITRRRMELEQKIELRTRDLLENKERFELLAEQSRTITWEIDNTGLFVFMSDAVNQILGYAPEDLVGDKYFYEMYALTDYSGLIKKFRDLSKNKEPFENMENVAISHLGEEMWLSTNGIPKLNENGELIGYRGTYLDITDRKIAQLAQDELRTALDAHCIVAITDHQGDITYVNDKFCNISKYTREELIGKNHRIICSGYHSKSFFKDLWNTILEGSIWKGEIKNRAKDGTFYWVQTTIVPFLNAQGKPRQFVAIRTDITERKQIEYELEAAKEAAELANQTKSEFLANMSHEIRTPMNAVIGLSGLTLESDLNELQRDSLKKIYYSSKMLLGIINDILDYSKIEAGKLELDIHEFSLDDILNQIRILFGSAIDEKGLELYFNVPAEIPPLLMGDSLRLGQVFTNLVGNAIKFTEKGWIKLNVICLSKNDKEIKFRFEVNDSGIGMSNDEQKKLFKAFSQADTSTTRKFGGTGLGLVISSNLVNAMNGVLSVKSESDKGSLFHFDISLLISKNKSSIVNRSELNNKHLKILVVDDQKIAREVLANILYSWNVEIIEAKSGADAVVSVIDAENMGVPFDVILMDWNMPGELDGVQAIDKINHLRESGELATEQTPVLIVSAYQRKNIPSGLVPINGFLQKPVTKTLLYDAMVEAMGTHQSGILSSLDVVIPYFKNSSVLLVEDNELNQEVAQRWIGKTGVSLSIANNGREAVDLNAKHNFDLVLMDLQMPIMDGFEATRIIRENDKELPIVALSAAVLDSDRKKSSDAGMNGHLGKPIDERELYKVMKLWLKKSGQDSLSNSAVKPLPLSGFTKKLEGFDVARGLRSADNNVPFYNKILLSFKKQLIGEFQDIAVLIENKDTTVQDMVHTLKGIAGTVGATELEQLLISIDASYKANESIATNIIVQLSEAVEKVKISLNSLNNITVDDISISNETGKNLIRNILTLLQKSELVEDNDLAQVAKFINTVLGEGASDELIELIEAYDHEKAITVLSVLEKNIENSEL